ncbi:MAG: hypothetical protein RIS79_2482 [Verrucomicrobiota bacterium]|jgi:streptomycin 6-kinase
MPDPTLPIRAATETALAHGITPDRCDILQNSSTLVVRLTETLVARVVQDRAGPRQGTGWFARENAMAQHLTQHGAPVIPLHPDLPPGPHEHLDYPLNFWAFVTRIDAEPDPREIGLTLKKCHEVMKTFPEPLPHLAIIHESLAILDDRPLFPAETQNMLHRHLQTSLDVLADYPRQPLHGDAHAGNLMNTTQGLLWTDWEDTFSGPVEWDVASIIWNARFLDEDHATVAAIGEAYGPVDEKALQQCLVARAAVITVWYPILYPAPTGDRQEKLRRRLAWLEGA